MSRLRRHRFADLWLNDFDFGMPDANLLLKPETGAFITMPEQHRVRGDLPDKIQQICPIGVRGQIKILHFALAGHLPGAGAEDKGFAVLGRL